MPTDATLHLAGQALVTRLASWGRACQSRTRVTIWLAVLATTAFFTLRRHSLINFQNQHLGWECFNVARALVDGRGFSDPFSEPTGPTAWVSPAYSLVLAGLLLVLKEKGLVATAVVAVTSVVLVCVGVSLFELAATYRSRVSAGWMVVLYVTWVGAFHYWFFILTADVWLLLLIAHLMLVAMVRYNFDGHLRPVKWGTLGGIGALTSPALGMSWFVVIGFLSLKQRGRARSWLVALAISAALIAPWTIRNAIVFHQFVPMKSNAGYEAYQANVTDDDGIYDKDSFGSHPAQLEDVRFQYARLGETEFVAEYAARFRMSVQAHPWRYARRVLQRTIAATLHDIPMWPSQNTVPEFVERAVKNVFYPTPLLALVFLSVTRGPYRSMALALAVFMGAFLAPYLAIAFYVRFLLPLTPMLLFVLFLGLDQIAARRTGGYLRPQAAAGAFVNPILTQESV